MARRPILGANWKCNPDSISKLDGLPTNIDNCDASKCDVYVCPSTMQIDYRRGTVTNGAMVAPQDCNPKGCRAYTGSMAGNQVEIVSSNLESVSPPLLYGRAYRGIAEHILSEDASVDRINEYFHAFSSGRISIANDPVLYSVCSCVSFSVTPMSGDSYAFVSKSNFSNAFSSGT